MKLNPRYEPFLKPFNQAEAQIRELQWFADGWIITSGPFHDGEGVWLGLWKGNWFNDDFRGVHFEISLGWGGYKMNHVVSAMHVLHQDTFPGTDKDRMHFSVPFVQSPEVRRIIRSWKAGYRVNLKGGMVPLRLNAPRTDDNITEVIVTEVSRLQQLGPEIDRILHEQIIDTQNK